MKTSKLLIGLITAVLCSVHSSAVCSDECQSTIAKQHHRAVQLQHRVVELELLLKQCKSLSATDLISQNDGADMESGRTGRFLRSEGRPRQLLQSLADYTQHGLTDMSADNSSGAGPAETIRFALLLPMSGSWRGGPQIAGAAALAVEKVNADATLLPGRRLEYSWADSGCSAKQGLAAMGELATRARVPDALIGPGCSAACEVTSYLAGGRNIPQISYVRFPLFEQSI